MKHSPPPASMLIDAAEFYWATLTVPASVRTRGSRDRVRALGHLLETHLPVSLENVHTTYCPLPSGGYIAYAIDHSRLRALVADDPAVALPQRVPNSVIADAHEMPVLSNILHGEFTPRHALRSRRRAGAILAASGALALLLLTLGLERRTAAFKRDAADSLASIEELAHQHAPGSSTIPPIMRLTAEARRLDALKRSAPDESVPADAAADLSSLLQRWPPSVNAQLETLRVERGAAAISVLFTSSEAISDLVEPVTRDDRWRAAQPTLNTTAQGMRAKVSFSATATEQTR
jgi:hypothetical protein